MLVACSGYKDWHEVIFGKENIEKLLPISEEELKSYCIALFKLGYAPSTMMQVHVNGLCTWVRGCCVCLLSSKMQWIIRLLLMRTTKALILQICVFSATSKSEIYFTSFHSIWARASHPPRELFQGLPAPWKSILQKGYYKNEIYRRYSYYSYFSSCYISWFK